MRRVSLPALGTLALLFATSVVNGQPKVPDDKSPGDETSPALFALIREHLATKADLKPAAGLTIQGVEYFRGEVRVRGTARTPEQRAALARELESIRARLELTADVRIRAFDLGGLQVTKTEPPPKKEPKPPVPPQVGPKLPPTPGPGGQTPVPGYLPHGGATQPPRVATPSPGHSAPTTAYPAPYSGYAAPGYGYYYPYQGYYPAYPGYYAPYYGYSAPYYHATPYVGSYLPDSPYQGPGAPWHPGYPGWSVPSSGHTGHPKGKLFHRHSGGRSGPACCPDAAHPAWTGGGWEE